MLRKEGCRWLGWQVQVMHVLQVLRRMFDRRMIAITGKHTHHSPLEFSVLGSLEDHAKCQKLEKFPRKCIDRPRCYPVIFLPAVILLKYKTRNDDRK
jgi:hypothetical protein